MAAALLSMTSRADETVASASNTTGSSTSNSGDVANGMATSSPTPRDYRDSKFEAGLIIGEPTGLSAKYWLNDTMAVDGALGWSFHRETDVHIHSDVLWHRFDVFDVSTGHLPLYFGVGARVKFRDHRDDLVGIRVPVGVNYLFEDVPVSLFVEVAPVLDLAPSTRGGLTAGVGARFRF